MKRYRAQLFGPFRILLDGDPLGAGAPRLASARTLLKWFLLHPGRPCTATELTTMLWPGSPSAPARRRLTRTVHALRSYLEPDREGRRSSAVHSVERGGYRFDPGGRWQVDLWDVESLVEQARTAEASGDPIAAIEALERLPHVQDRPFLPEDLHNDHFADARAAVDRACAEAGDSLLRSYVRAGRLGRAQRLGLEALDRDPYSETAAWAVVSAYALENDRVSALRVLSEFRGRLREDLDVDPAAELLDLESMLRTGSTELIRSVVGEPLGAVTGYGPARPTPTSDRGTPRLPASGAPRRD